MKTLEFILLLALAMVLASCSNGDRGPQETAPVSPLHEADQCPTQLSGGWDYQVGGVTQKQLHFHVSQQKLITVYDSTDGEPLPVDGVKRDLDNGQNVLAYCNSGDVNLQFNENGAVTKLVVHASADGQSASADSTAADGTVTSATLKRLSTDEVDHAWQQVSLGVGTYHLPAQPKKDLFEQ